MIYHCHTTQIGVWWNYIHFSQIIDKGRPISIYYVYDACKHSTLMFPLHHAKQTKIKKPDIFRKMLSIIPEVFFS
jgi:hypothetical protein